MFALLVARSAGGSRLATAMDAPRLRRTGDERTTRAAKPLLSRPTGGWSPGTVLAVVAATAVSVAVGSWRLPFST